MIVAYFGHYNLDWSWMAGVGLSNKHLDEVFNQVLPYINDRTP